MILSLPVSTPEGEGASRPEPYRYKGSRPYSVFGLAIVATVGVLGMTWGAYSALAQATHEERIAPPPNLNKVIPQARRAAEKLAGSVGRI